MRNSIALLVVAGLMLVLIGAHYLFPGLPQRWYHKVFLGEDYISPDVQFTRTATGIWLNPGGEENARKPRERNYSWYRSTDMVTVLVQIEYWSSEAEADERMQEKIMHASRVVERNEHFDVFGERVGPRAVLLMADRDGEAIAIWTDKSKVVTIESSSLPHVIEFDRRGSKPVLPQPRR